MTATKAKQKSDEPKVLKAYRVTLDSPLVPRITTNVHAASIEEAKRIVLAWVEQGTTVTEL
jgi:hypothetical protein